LANDHTSRNNSDLVDPKDEIYVAAICAGLVCILIVINLALVPLIEPKNYTLTFNGELTYNNGPMMLAVDNNNKSNLKKIIIYGTTGNTTISATHLMDESHLAIKSADITFGRNLTFPLNVIKGEPKVINVSIKNIQPGEYSGAIIFKGNTTVSVPIKVATEPLIINAFLWVLIGILLSVILWELINYLTFQQHHDTYKKHTQAKHTQLKNTQEQELKQKLNDELYIKIRKHTLWHRNRWHGAGLKKQTIYIIGSAGFAMSVGVISLFTNDFVTGQLVIGPVEIVVLIGIGLGAGSLKEFVDRPPSWD
jgi:hypothetical protein